jgi:hypothetical protein
VHVLEYPWEAARSLFGADDRDAEDWVAPPRSSRPFRVSRPGRS